jgi:hypothetical protein
MNYARQNADLNYNCNMQVLSHKICVKGIQQELCEAILHQQSSHSIWNPIMFIYFCTHYVARNVIWKCKKFKSTRISQIIHTYIALKNFIYFQCIRFSHIFRNYTDYLELVIYYNEITGQDILLDTLQSHHAIENEWME